MFSGGSDEIDSVSNYVFHLDSLITIMKTNKYMPYYSGMYRYWSNSVMAFFLFCRTKLQQGGLKEGVIS